MRKRERETNENTKGQITCSIHQATDQRKQNHIVLQIRRLDGTEG